MAAVEQRYAKALADLVAKGALPADIARRELDEVAGMAAASPALRTVMASPAVSWEHKRAVLEALAAKAGLSPLSRNFLLVAAQRGRFSRLPGMAHAFEELLLERQGVMRAEVISARTLGDSERAAIAGELEQRLGRKLETRYRIDPELLGGFIARIGDEVYDGSIRGRLQRLRQALVSA